MNMIKRMKPILGVHDVVVTDYKKLMKEETEDKVRFTVTLSLKLTDSEREFKDVIFYDSDNAVKCRVYTAIVNALANQIGLAIDEYRTEDGDEYYYDDDRVLEELKGKTITIERYESSSDRNDEVYINTTYNVVSEEADVDL